MGAQNGEEAEQLDREHKGRSDRYRQPATKPPSLFDFEIRFIELSSLK